MGDLSDRYWLAIDMWMAEWANDNDKRVFILSKPDALPDTRVQVATTSLFPKQFFLKTRVLITEYANYCGNLCAAKDSFPCATVTEL